MVPNDVIENFNRTFKRNQDVIRPDLCGELHTTTIYEISEEERQLLYEPPKEERKITEKEKTTRKIVDARVEHFRNTFFQLNKRYPTQEEIKIKFETIYDNDDYTKNEITRKDTLVLDTDSVDSQESSPNLNLEVEPTEENANDGDNSNDGDNTNENNDGGDNGTSTSSTTI